MSVSQRVWQVGDLKTIHHARVNTELNFKVSQKLDQRRPAGVWPGVRRAALPK